MCVAGVPAFLALAGRTDSTNDPSQVAVRIDASGCGREAVGSGFLVSGSRLITNRHVVDDASLVSASTAKGGTISTGVVSVSSDSDVAVIAARGVDGTTVVLANHDPRPGAWVRAIGFANAAEHAVVTLGRVVDQIEGDAYGEPGTIIRSTADVERGNSGGPLLDEAGRVVGLVFAIERQTGYTLAIPVSRLHELVDRKSTMTEVPMNCSSRRSISTLR